jgi:hypothetical protein
MNTAGVKPNKKTLTALMGACIAGKQYSAAVDVFSKIKNPDSYAISVGLKALCYAEKWNEALELINDQKSGQKMLTGKEVMMGYNNLLQRALESGAFSVAREAFVSFHDTFLRMFHAILLTHLHLTVARLDWLFGCRLHPLQNNVQSNDRSIKLAY